MRAIVQRVSKAAVVVEGVQLASIGPGMVVLVGVSHDDTGQQVKKLASKLANLRIFSDRQDKMNLSLLDIAGEVLLISQFTLYGDLGRGNRPSFMAAAKPELARPLIDELAQQLSDLGVSVGCGRFGAHMEVSLVNDGPVTLSLDIV